MLQVEGLTKRFGERVLFEGLTFALERGNKVGLIAPNGSGKTTLMNILVGKEPYESGSITHESNLRWAYLPQLPELPSKGTILQACFNPYDQTAQIVMRWEEALINGDDRTMEQLLPEMEATDGWSYEQRAKEVLGALGLHDVQRSVVGISGGEKKRIALAATLISQPELLYLDEPTNHLDLKSIEWLEQYLSRSTISLVLITHDRYFLDRVCNQIIELDGGELYRYRGNYDYYLEKRKERHEADAANVSRAQNLYRRELDWIRRQPQARGGKARYRIEAFQELEQRLSSRRTDSAQVQLLGSDAGHIGNKIFEAHGVEKRFGDKIILRHFDYTFARRDKIGIVGDNGVGKTTLLKMLLGLEPCDKGHFDIGQTVRFGYYSQDAPNFPQDQRVIDVIKDIAEEFEGDSSERLSASQILTQFLFPPERQYTPVGKLSGGELRRLYLCSVLVSKPNFLILDEPTNDLDILTLNVLEEHLEAFTGCVLIVSHDRYFMDKVAQHLLCLEGDGIVRDFPGNYSLYRAWQEQQLAPSEQKVFKSPTSTSPAESRRQDRPRAPKLSFAEARELEMIGRQVTELEAEQRRLEDALGATTDAGELTKLGERIGIIIDQLDMLVLRQLELEDKTSK